MTNKRQVVVCAAIKDHNGTVVCSPRHFDSVMRDTVDAVTQYDTGNRKWEQGFVDQHGKFLTREEAWGIALHAGQIINRVDGDGEKLFSENLY